MIADFNGLAEIVDIQNPDGSHTGAWKKPVQLFLQVVFPFRGRLIHGGTPVFLRFVAGEGLHHIAFHFAISGKLQFGRAALHGIFRRRKRCRHEHRILRVSHQGLLALFPPRKHTGGQELTADVINLPASACLHRHIDVVQKIALGCELWIKGEVVVRYQRGARIQTSLSGHGREDHVHFIGEANSALEYFRRGSISVFRHALKDPGSLGLGDIGRIDIPQVLPKVGDEARHLLFLPLRRRRSLCGGGFQSIVRLEAELQLVVFFLAQFSPEFIGVFALALAIVKQRPGAFTLRAGGPGLIARRRNIFHVSGSKSVRFPVNGRRLAVERH